MRIPSCIAILIAIAAFAPTAAVADPAPSELLAHADDYVFGYHPYGWRGRDAAGNMVFAVQTSHYTLLLNASHARIDGAGIQPQSVPSSVAAQAPNNALLAPLPNTPLTFNVRVGEAVYDAVSGAPKPEDLVIQRLGKYLVNVEVRNVVLKDAGGAELPGAHARLILNCWPDQAIVRLQIDADAARSDVVSIAQYAPGSDPKNVLSIANTLPAAQRLNSTGGESTIESGPVSLSAGASTGVSATLLPSPDSNIHAQDLVVRATGIAPYTGDLGVTYDATAGWHQILLGPNSDIQTMERVRINLENPSDFALPAHLAFSKRGGGFGITGLSPVLCDISGAPLGLPVQISKNWHVSPAWFDGITIVQLPPHSTHSFEFRLAYATWGGVPAVAHAQLCLEGWGTHQLWDQMAIGSFGESICYDPDINLNRAMIDDMRPLMVWGMGKDPQRKWSWTHNVGGGDFLVLFQDGKRQYLSRQKTDYIAQGPVLTTVRYTGETPDGALQSQITTQSWRSDDYVRGLYTIRYDVLKSLPFSRLAFFQLAADHYNENLFTTISRGDLSGVQETWNPSMGGKQYSRDRVALEGSKPWFALTGARKNPPPAYKADDQGAWANRGFIVHRWAARLGGKDISNPHYAVFGTENGQVPSAVVELAPTPGLAQLEPGDYVDATVEMLILPQRAEDYYGPNEPLRAALKDHPDDWYLVYREARASNLRVTAKSGQVESQWPIVVRAENGTKAEFTVDGGAGYTPITIVGATRHTPFQFATSTGGDARPVAQSDSNDWWQARYQPTANTYDLVFTVPLDGESDSAAPRTFAWTANVPCPSQSTPESY